MLKRHFVPIILGTIYSVVLVLFVSVIVVIFYLCSGKQSLLEDQRVSVFIPMSDSKFLLLRQIRIVHQLTPILTLLQIKLYPKSV